MAWKSASANSEREVPIPRATADDLAALHAALGRPAASELVFGIDGEMWGKEQWRRWASKTFKPEACAIGRIGARPYDLRHSFVLRLIVQGKTVPEVACLAGHTPTVTTDVYLGAYREFEQIGIGQAGDILTKPVQRA